MPLYHESMESPQEVKENKKALKIFGVESVIIIVLIVVIIAILSYLKVFSLSGIFQNIPGISKPTPTFSPEAKAYFESQRKKQMQEIEQRKPNPNLPKSISIVSDIPSVSASIADEKGLIDLLTSWGVYGRLYDSNSGLANGSMNGKRLESIVVNLVTEPQIANRYVKGDDVYSSSFVDLNPGEMTINIQIDPSRSDSYAQQVMFQLVTMLTKLTNPITGEEQGAERNKHVEARYAPLREESPKYFIFNK